MSFPSTIRRFVKNTCFNLATDLFGDADGMLSLPVLAGPAKGLRFRVDLKKRREAYLWGKYDRCILAELVPIIRPGWTIWDCGTYLGFYTSFFARAVGPAGRVVAIEPDSRNLKRTADNAVLNGFKNVQLANLAIGAPAGYVEFLLSDDTNSHLPGCYMGECAAKDVWRAKDVKLVKTSIECVSLDQAYFEKKLPAPNLIKIDIEGAEKDGIKHLYRLVKEVRPLIVLELHNPECDAAAWEFSQASGYKLRSFNTGAEIVEAAQVRGTLLCYPS